MKKIFIPVFFTFLLTVTVAYGMQIDVSVEEGIGGNIEYVEMNEEVNDSLQEFIVQWYNTESVSCLTRFEFEIYNSTDRDEKIKSVWTEEKEMHPGTSDHFRTYWHPESTGNFSVNIRVRHCNEIITEEAGNFTVTETKNTTDDISLESTNLPDNRIQINVDTEHETDDLIAVPEDEPTGWIVEPSEFDGNDTTTINYEASIFEPENISYRVFSHDGTLVSQEEKVEVRQVKTFWGRHGFYILLIAIIFLLSSNIYLTYNHFKKNKE